jgi:DNA-directed RNA polymerase subunit F
MKYLTETFGIEEYKIPDTELTPLEYNFEVPYDFDSQGLQDDDATSEDFFTEDAAREYADNSSVEYFDYFDYYHSKPDNSNEVVEELKDIGNSLLDSTKDKVNTVVAAIAELEPIKDQPEVHVIDDQFSGAIDVFPVAQEAQSMKITSNNNKTSIGGFFR